MISIDQGRSWGGEGYDKNTTNDRHTKTNPQAYVANAGWGNFTKMVPLTLG